MVVVASGASVKCTWTTCNGTHHVHKQPSLRYNNRTDDTSAEPPSARSLTCSRKQEMLYKQISVWVHSVRTGFDSVRGKYMKSLTTYCLCIAHHAFLYDRVLFAESSKTISSNSCVYNNWRWAQVVSGHDLITPYWYFRATGDELKLSYSAVGTGTHRKYFRVGYCSNLASNPWVNDLHCTDFNID